MVEKWTVDQVNPEAVGISSLRLERVRKWLDSQVSSGRVPGVSALIARRGRVAFFEASGIADVASSRPFTQDTIVRIFSMTKPITSVAAMMLYEEGLFQLDDPVGLYLPEFTKSFRKGNQGDSMKKTHILKLQKPHTNLPRFS